MPATIACHHLDVGGRRVHYRRAGSGPPVLLLHESPRSSAALLPMLEAAPPGVTVLALDTPGNGLSMPLAHAAPDAPAYADALADTMDALGLARAAVCGTHSGAAFATTLAARHPQRVAGLVLDGISAFDAVEQENMLGAYLPPFVPGVDGAHLAWLWSRVRDQALFFPWNDRRAAARRWRPMPPPHALQRAALDLLRAGDAYRAPYRAAIAFDPGPALAALTMPAIVAARASDVLRPHLARLPALPAHVAVATLPDDAGAATAQLWRWLVDAARGLVEAPPASDAALPRSTIGDTLIGTHGERLHVRGAAGGSGRPLLWLHPSPGGARGMDRQLEAGLGARPVIALDLPCHGDSDAWGGSPGALLDALQASLHALRFDDAELRGEGLGAAVAQALAQRVPSTRLDPATASAARPCPSSRPEGFTPRADGGHLMAAWWHARDEAVLGPWWTRAANTRFDGGDAIDLATVHARTIECLKEAPGAAALRAAWLAAQPAA